MRIRVCCLGIYSTLKALFTAKKSSRPVISFYNSNRSNKRKRISIEVIFLTSLAKISGNTSKLQLSFPSVDAINLVPFRPLFLTFS